VSGYSTLLPTEGRLGIQHPDNDLGARLVTAIRGKMIITSDLIARAEDLGACQPALEWLRAEPRTTTELCSANSAWYLLACGWFSSLADPALVDQCASRSPWAALEFAAPLLKASRLDSCAEREPCWAIRFAAHLLTAERLDQCAERVPCWALTCAASLLTPSRLDSCAERSPWAALEFAATLLTPSRLASCADIKAQYDNNS